MAVEKVIVVLYSFTNVAKQNQIHLFLYLLFQDYFLRVAVSYDIPINVPVAYMVRYLVVLYINIALCMLLVF
jgi:hypothetical protein